MISNLKPLTLCIPLFQINIFHSVKIFGLHIPFYIITNIFGYKISLCKRISKYTFLKMKVKKNEWYVSELMQVIMNYASNYECNLLVCISVLL